MTSSDFNSALIAIGVFLVFVFLFVIAVGASIISINSCFKDFVELYRKSLKDKELKDGKNTVSSEPGSDRSQE